MQHNKASLTFNEDCVFVESKVNKESDSWILLASDLHLDSKSCDRKWLKGIFDEVIEKNGIIILLGDVFDVMGGRDDKRSNKGDIKKQYQEDDYYDRVAEDVAEFLVPYVDNIGFISLGNHETAVTKHHEKSMLTALMLQIFAKCQKKINIVNKYTGWVKFRTEKGKTRGGITVWNMWYHHGSGGGAVMSYGVLKTKRRQAVLDADIFVTGHTHQAWTLPLVKEGITDQGNLYQKECIHIQLGTAKDTSAWERKREFGFPTKTFYWLNFYYQKGNVNVIEQRVK